MILPNYQGNSIVNLMSSIGGACGWDSPYEELKILPANDLENVKNIVLLVIDGLGYEYILKHGKGNKILTKSKVKGKITSVFPSSTASAATVFITGDAAREHGITGWFTYLKEIGAVTTLLPFETRAGKVPLRNMGIKAEELLDFKSFFEKINIPSIGVAEKELGESDFYLYSVRGSENLYYSGVSGLIEKLNEAIKKDNAKKYIYGYCPYFDSLSHVYGSTSEKVSNFFKLLDNELACFLDLIKDTNTKIIITADHGMIDTKLIKMEDHPVLQEALTLPLCGDHRTVFCYVHPSKKSQFETYVKSAFGDYCKLYKSEDLVKKGNIWGMFQPNARLAERIGDYTLIMKDNYALADKLSGEDEDHAYPICNHGGLSKEEMYVPLIVVDG